MKATKNVTLTKELVEVRIGTIFSTTKGYIATLLLYQDARASMTVLDNLYPGWQRHHQNIGGMTFCTISVYDSEKQIWITREDVGTAGEFEKEKSAVSDSFKRAATNFIPAFRALYNAPKIKIILNDDEITETKNGKFACNTEFIVSELAYDEEKKTFTALKIVDEYGEVRYDLTKPVKKVNTGVRLKPATATTTTTTKTPATYSGCTCTGCGKKISDKVASFSLSKFKRHLCMDCQKQARAVA